LHQAIVMLSTVAAAAASAPATAAPAAAAPAGVTVTIHNPLPTPRTAATIAVNLAEVRRLALALEPAKTLVVDDKGKPVLSQLVDVDGDDAADELVFQADLGARQTRRFELVVGQRPAPRREDFKVYGRFVRERHDDFAWENDRIAHRMYGTDLETWRKEPLTSSGIDVWCKRTRKLVINDWYMVDDYHRDHGEGADLYSVGKTRGCGGSGVWTGDKLAVSRNFTTSRVLANGPVRLVFELGYAPWDAGGVKVSETKRITLDAGSNFDTVESTYRIVDGAAGGASAPLHIGVGVANHDKANMFFDKRAGWMRTWEPVKPADGNLGCGVIVGLGAEWKTTATDNLLVGKATPNVPFVTHIGAAWDRSGDVADAAAWTKQVEEMARAVAAPVRITLSPSRQAAGPAGANADSWARRAADTVMAAHPGKLTDNWHYDTGLVLYGIESVWRRTGDPRYLDYVKATIDSLLDAGGASIKGYAPEESTLDDINMGKVLFALHAAATDPAEKRRYRKVLDLLRAQLDTQPRTGDGGFWHKKIYPNQMWADGAYMAAPFLARYATVFAQPAALDEAAKQILLAESHLRDVKTGLLYHGWDERKAERWANPKTGTSPQFWGRGVGWYAMAVADVLAEMPVGHRQRPAVQAVLQRLAAAIAAVQDKTTGVWWQVLDAGGRPGNYREASASAMFVYALSKGVKAGWLDAKIYGPVAARGYAGMLNQFVEDKDQRVRLNNVCKVAGLGGKPYRDGSYEYYVGAEVVADDPKGVGAFILAAAERS